ncbi:peptidase M56 [Flavobacterium circumlabens]|uniref:Peptidase M56 n=1 Tax=Flavobacterium circumlabens TaxID=2133765 RepID=A0A4Y7UBS5_9FLAO|nr:M56 family metallopeptidase [Flavobacterium circumlabens]TCN55343.1 BlaR1 peptidase M56 [Flavobacterium circumlabens]TEB43232.1 peptidase M56 [Flavobacterium circumlabens]
MEALFIFIAKSSGLLALFYLAYYLLLRKETFFNSNRWFLLSGLITAVVLPFLVYTKVIWVDPVPVSNMAYSPVFTPGTIQEESFEIDWNLVSLAIYALGFTAFLVKFGIDFYSLNSVLKGKKVQQQADFKFIDINENIAPFSYFDYIVYNSSLYSASELENIIEHEKVHSDQNHTIDVLISRIFCVLFWFNPIIWLYKKAILQNLEFIADSEAAKKISDKKAYQYTLLKITTHESCVAITNHFYQSLIKKRIVMLNKNQSKKRNYLKYYAIIPALLAFVLLFQVKTIAQEKASDPITNIDPKGIESMDVFNISKNTTDAEIAERIKILKEKHQIKVSVSDLKRDSKNEITSIQIELKNEKGVVKVKRTESTNGIDKIGIIIIKEKSGKISFNFSDDEQIKNIDRSDEDQDDEIREVENVDAPDAPDAPGTSGTPTPPTPPAPPVFPGGPMPQVPASAMANMPKPPTHPGNVNDKAAMKKFEKEMAEFEKKMEAFEPDMAAYEKEVEEVMSKREAIFEKEMEKYEVAMEKYNADMQKFNQENQQNVNFNNRQYQIDMKQHAIDMKQYEKDMKQHAKDMKQQEKDMKQHQKDMIQHQKDMAKQQKERANRQNN